MAEGEQVPATGQQGGQRRMVPQGRVLTMVLGIVTVVAVGVSGVAIVSLGGERQHRLAKERELSLVNAEKESVERQLQDIRQAKQQLESEFTKTKDQLSQMVQQLADERRAKEILAQSIDERQKEIDRLSQDLQQLRAERDELATKTTQWKGQQDTLQAQLAELTRAKSELESKVLELAEGPSIELDTVLIADPGTTGGASETTSPGLSSSQGQVIVVNREYDFVVVNLGKNQGLSLGQEFQVVRGEEVLGRVKVEKLYDELSAAAILPESKKDEIREGDVVRPI